MGVDPHSLLLRGQAIAEVAIAAGMAEAEICERPGAAFRSRHLMLDRRRLAAIGLPLERIL
jgi:hypothetical protein